MIRPLLLAAASVGALVACSPKADDSVANSFDRTEKAIENTADTLEAETENATRAASDALEREAGEFANRAEAASNAVTTNSQTGNSAR
jgi:hypothetical protein